MKRILFVFVLVLAALGTGRINLRATILTWNGSTSTAWNNATNWLPQQVPTASDTVFFNSGTLTATTNTAFTNMTWTGGSLFGGLTVASGSTLYLGGSTLGLYGVLTNAGTVVATNTSYLRIYYSPPSYYGALYNLAGGLIDIKNDQFILDYNYGPEIFNNAGTLRKSGGSGTTIIYPKLINSGLMDAQTGTISYLLGGGPITGQFHAAAGATVSFDSGSYTVGTLPALTGPGAFKFKGSTLTLLSNTVPNLQMLTGTLLLGPGFQGGSITNLTLAGMTLQTTNTVSGTMTWTAGVVAGALTVSNGATLYLGGSTLLLYGVLTNAGTVVATNTSYLRIYYSPPSTYGALYNLAGGLIDIKNDQFILDYQYGPEIFNNAGTLRKSGGTGTTIIYPKLINSGLMDAQTGTISYLLGGGPISGQFNAAAGATVSFDSGSYTVGTLPTLTGPGAFKFKGSTLTLLTNVVPNLQMLTGTLLLGPGFQGGSITNLALAGMTLGSINTVTGTMTWTAGAVAGALTVANGATLYLGGSTLFLYGALTNAGTVVATNTSYLKIYYSPPTYNGALYNLAGGLIDIKNDQFILDYNYGPEIFNNAGTLRKSAGSGTTIIYPKLNNSGLLDVQTGTVTLQKIPDLTGGELRFGLSSLNNFGKINIPGSAILNGTIGVVWLGGYVPATNNSFAVLTYGSHTGIFTSLDLPSPALWTTNYTATTFTLTVGSINNLMFSAPPVGGKLTNVILVPVVVQVNTPAGVPFATNGVPITLALVDGGPINGTLVQNTDATGKATFNNLSFSQPGFKTLRASSASQTPVTSLVFRIFAVQEVQWTTNGFLLSLNGSNNLGTTIIYATTNLTSPFIPIYTNLPTTGSIQFLDSASTNYRARFYHAIEQ